MRMILIYESLLFTSENEYRNTNHSHSKGYPGGIGQGRLYANTPKEYLRKIISIGLLPKRLNFR
jgi:hypothetical protein